MHATFFCSWPFSVFVLFARCNFSYKKWKRKMNVSIRTNRLQIWNQEEWHLFQGKKSVFIFANGPFRLHGGSNITDVELDCRKLNCSIQAHTQQWQNQIPMAIDQNWCYCFLRSQFCCTDLLLQAWHFFHFSILLLLLPRFFCCIHWISHRT